MKLLSPISNTVIRSSTVLSSIVVAFALFLVMATAAQAAPITGTPVGNTFGWTPNSTNALNYAKLVPTRVGQTAPYVLFNTNAIGSVTLDFFNQAPGLAYFEYRIDGVATGSTAHPVVIGDTIHSGFGVATMTNDLGHMFSPTNYVDIRLALGGERDWDFDWVRFDAKPIPEPTTLLLLGSGLVGLAGFRRRFRNK